MSGNKGSNSSLHVLECHVFCFIWVDTPDLHCLSQPKNQSNFMNLKSLWWTYMHCGNGLQRFACCLSKLQETEDAIGVAWTTTNLLHSYSNLEAHNVIGASAVSPTLVVKTENCLYVCLVHAYSVYIHPALFVRNTIFPHCMLVHVTTVAQETRPARQKGWVVGTNITETWKQWGKGGTTSKTYTDY